MYNINTTIVSWNKKTYSKYDSKIGLALDEKKEVILNFPDKDCVLVGWMDKEEKENCIEMMYNEVLDKEKIDILFEPKIFSNIKKYTASWEEKEVILNKNNNWNIKDNLIIKGNNLLALHSLKTNFYWKVKMIYIDPPYNTWNDYFNYNDNFNHSTWLTFMKNRLEIAKELLRNDGVIFIQCDDNEQAYLKVLMDNIFGRDKMYWMIIQLKWNAQNDSKSIQRNHEYILCYSRTNTNGLLTDKFLKEHKVYEESYYLWRDSWASAAEDTLAKAKSLGYTIYYYEGSGNGATGNDNTLAKAKSLGYTDFSVIYKDNKVYHAIALNDYDKDKIKENSNEKEVYTTNKELVDLGYKTIRPPKRTGWKLWRWTWSLEIFKELWNENRVLIKNDKNVIRKEFVDKKDIIIKNGKQIYIKEAFRAPKSIIDINNSKWTTHLKSLFWEEVFKNPKSEDFLEYLIFISTKPWDIVLDYHLGSWTTTTVAHKMWRQYIGIEQMDYIKDVTVERMKKVIEGEQWGISKNVEWKGWGEFIYMELLESDFKKVKSLIKNSTVKEDLIKIIEENFDKWYFQYINSKEDLLKKIEEKKNVKDSIKMLIEEYMDYNLDYEKVNDLEKFKGTLSEVDYNFNKDFYNLD